MTREERLEFCLLCKKNTYNPKLGVICSLTNNVATFEGTCPDYLADEKEVKRFNEKKEEEKKGVNKTINQARYILFIIGVSYIVLGYIEAFVIPFHHIVFGYIDWGIAVIFIGLGFLSLYHPRPALIAGLSLYVFILLIVALFDFSTVLQGIIWKIIVVVMFVYGIKATHMVKHETKTNTDDLLDQL
ncbi:MAG: hypothetical protein IT222_03485 [Crocinitomix sp.]|nr:hypothetical protein [Crocinitomix sp.]